MNQLLLFLFLLASGISAHSQVLKDAYKNTFLIGVAVNLAIVSGSDKASLDIVLGILIPLQLKI